MLDKKREKYEFLNTDRVWVTDYKGIKLGKILADNLIDTYILVNIKLDKLYQGLRSRKTKNELLDIFKFDQNQKHATLLCEMKYQAKLLRLLAEYISSLSEDEAIK